MPKLKQRDQTETPQIQSKQNSTATPGGRMPSKEAVIRSANARGGKRHEMKDQALADVGVLPDSDMMVGDERVGIKNHEYLVKKGLEYGVNVHYNTLPPGMDIEDQENCDIRRMEFKSYRGGIGYPGDGWADPEGSKLDMGRPSETNYMGGKAT